MNTKSEIITAIDIGTTKIVAIAGRKTENNRFEIIGFGATPSKGMKRGVVANIDETVKSICIASNSAFDNKEIPKPLEDTFVGIAGQHVRSIAVGNNMIINSHDSIITKQDLVLLKDLVLKTSSEAGEEILDAIPQSYMVDKEKGIENPIGMSGKILHGNYHVIVGQMSMINNIKKCVTLSGLKVKTLILEPLASAEAVLTKEEKEAGVAMIDIGGGTTDLAIYKDNKVIHTAVIPVGGNTITNDIKQELGILEKQAEDLKINFGSAIQDKNQENTIFAIDSINGAQKKQATLKELSAIIQARMEEILHAVVFQIDKAGIKGNLPGGIVITGGGSLLKNLKQLAAFITNHNIRIAFPTEYIEGKFSDILNNPQYSTAVGLIMKGYTYLKEKEESENSFESKINTPIEEENTEKNEPENPKDEKDQKSGKGFMEKFTGIFSKLLEDEDEK